MKKKLLVLEDEAQIVDVLKVFLDAEFDVSYRDNTSEIVEADLVLSDLTLTDGDPSKWLLLNYSSKNIPVVVYSGVEPRNVETYCQEHNFKTFWQKPLGLRTLAQRLKDLCGTV